MATRNAEDRTGREHFGSQTHEIRNLLNCDETHQQLSLNSSTFLCCLPCMKNRGANFKFMLEKGGLLEMDLKERGLNRAFTVFIIAYLLISYCIYG